MDESTERQKHRDVMIKRKNSNRPLNVAAPNIPRKPPVSRTDLNATKTAINAISAIYPI